MSAIILKKNETVLRETGSVRHGAAAVPYPAGEDSPAPCMERLKGFIIKAGTILFLACVVMWFLGSYGFGPDGFGLVESSDSLIAVIGGVIAPLFAPLGFGEWQPVAASISGFTAKEAIVSTMGTLAAIAGDVEDPVTVAQGVAAWFPTSMAAFSFLLFNLLDSPCLAAISTMAQQDASPGNGSGLRFCSRMYSLTWYALTVYQIGTFVLGGGFTFGTAGRVRVPDRAAGTPVPA